MSKPKIIFLFLFLSLNSIAQVNSKILGKSYWLSQNENSEFFKSDTVEIISFSPLKSEKDKWNESKFKSELNDNKDFVELSFKSNHRLKFSTINIDTWEVSEFKGNQVWQFNEKKQTINLKFKALDLNFKIINLKYEIVKSRFSSENIKLVKIKLLKIK
ncbi:hypothetical protein HUK80_17380 [Flavobacterium sp. MAH-1]|uniref:Lipocalin-like domain-containing protein n=1 Tax=Flavobacterium agri TaxID=2743471 RepID=A0A7Y8Y554_9FLAO|nr:hypothetical protein [Flavobacterium agri]NUY82678.1 hypothetical protein [Flavobacterium agri]NYA72701.1 hypothetical protein [Flavobacterium agri]